MWKFTVSWTLVSVFFIGAQVDPYGRVLQSINPARLQIKTSERLLAREFTGPDAKKQAVDFIRKAPIKIGELVQASDYVKDFGIDSVYVPTDTLKQNQPEQKQ